MIEQRFFALALVILPMYYCMDGYLISSIKIHSDVGVISCPGLNLTIDEKNNNPLCENGVQINDTSFVTLTYNNGTGPITDLKNITLWLQANVASLGDRENETQTLIYTGVFIIDTKSDPNKVLVGTVTLNKELPATTVKPKQRIREEELENPDPNPPIVAKISNTTVLTINYLHLKYSENSTVVNKNGGAVAVAIIEGIALIAILAYMGYRTMVKHRMKETTMNTAMYGYDNNSRITVPDSIRMNDIPPPRDPTYATPPTPTTQPTITPTRNTVMTTQELVVPTSAVSQTRPNTTTNTTNQQFRDPFDTLENW